MINIFRKPQVYLTVLIFLMVIIVLSVIIIPFTQRKAPSPTPTPIPTSSLQKGIPQIVKPPSTKELPYKPVDRGGGIDLQSEAVQSSVSEIRKLNSQLPYQTDLNLSTGLRVSIVIPGTQFQTDNWTLTVQVFGINYRVTEDDKDYTVMRRSFLEASNQVFEWMRSKGVDPNKIIVSWGDKAFIQESAEKWLKEQ